MPTATMILRAVLARLPRSMGILMRQELRHTRISEMKTGWQLHHRKWQCISMTDLFSCHESMNISSCNTNTYLVKMINPVLLAGKIISGAQPASD
ncbi:MAG: hypothetical protein HY016_04925 [Nitrosomonadales bacterium]|nr:hypothetical protein [Nitrosomonadales bacterium]